MRKGYLLLDPNYDILEKAKVMETVKGSVVARGWGRMTRQSREDWQGG